MRQKCGRYLLKGDKNDMIRMVSRGCPGQDETLVEKQRRVGENMSQMIYIADDEKNIRNLITAFLRKEGYGVEEFETGDLMMDACRKRLPDLAVLDIMMPGTDGLNICTQLRQMSTSLPILIVSAKDSPYDRVAGLTLGSDDYMVKPFLPLELVVRVKALLRRSQAEKTDRNEKQETALFYGALRLELGIRKAYLGEKVLPLTPTEFDFMVYMVEHKERAVSREELLKTLWKMSWQADTRAADDLVKRLRKKLREQACQVGIETVWGFGFRLSGENGNES